jgi:HEAT repeat protein
VRLVKREGSYAITFGGDLLFLDPKVKANAVRSLAGNSAKTIDIKDYHANLMPAFPKPYIPHDPRQLFRRAFVSFDGQSGNYENSERIRALAVDLAGDDQTKILESLETLIRSQPREDDFDKTSIVKLSENFLHSESTLVRAKALQVIIKWNSERTADWKTIARSLNDTHDANRWLAIEALAPYPEPELARAILRGPIQDEPTAFYVIYQKYKEIAADAVAPLLKDSSARIRFNAIHIIAGTGGREHIEILKPFIEDKDEDCRTAAELAIARLSELEP